MHYENKERSFDMIDNDLEFPASISSGGGSSGSGIENTNVVSFAVSIANVTDADESQAQSNAAVIVAGGDVDSEQDNKIRLKEEEN